MQKNVRTKLLNDYSQLGFKGKSTCVKYRYDYNGVTVNLYFDAFDPDSNTLTMILSTEKQFYFTTLNSMNTRIRKEYLPKLPSVFLNKILVNNELDEFYKHMENKILEIVPVPVSYKKDTIFINTTKFQKGDIDLPFWWYLRKVPMSDDTLNALSERADISRETLLEIQKAMLDFAEKSDGNEADRTAEGFAKMFGSYFPPKFSITEGNAWMSVANNSVQYVATIRPGEDIAKLVKRMHYVSFVGMFRSDFFEGLCVGHAPKKCRICGKWFLTTNARHTKYCGGYAPGDKLHRTCRQIGNLKGREQRELADDHPLKQIYEKRLNTINRYVKRGTLDADLAEVMKKLAKDKMLRALSNVAYAKGDYEKEMGQGVLRKEALEGKNYD